jgi:hypothetical protein
MNNYQKLAQLLNVAEITEDYKGAPDLEIGTWNTADGYDVHVIANDPRNIDFEYDVFYYEPSFLQVIDRIKQLDADAAVYVSDFETYLPEYEVEDYIEEQEENLKVEEYDS